MGYPPTDEVLGDESSELGAQHFRRDRSKIAPQVTEMSWSEPEEPDDLWNPGTGDNVQIALKGTLLGW
jgi:hypothetical protein